MTVEIKTAALEPVRRTFSHIARRLGPDKTPTRYQEATFDLQADCNFHYQPLWDPAHELYDRRRTRIAMQDWYAFKDPRQFYYGTYVLSRSKMQEAAENNFAFVERHGSMATVPKALAARVEAVFLPLRHVEYGANLNNCFISAYGWGSAITSATTFAMMDRLGIAQYLSRIGLLIDGNSGASLDAAKHRWMTDPGWQPLRRLVEDTLVIKDWFELFLAQNLVIDGLLYPMVYGRFRADIARDGVSVVAMLTDFMDAWFAESIRWVDAFVKTAAVESVANTELLSGWTRTWRVRVAEALEPLARLMFGHEAAQALEASQGLLHARVLKIGLQD